MFGRQSLIALGVAVVLGLLAVYFANIFLTSTEQRASSGSTGTVKVAVAAVPLDFGVELTAEKVRFADFPATSVPPGAYRRIAELLPAGKKRVALRPMLVNEPILASKISAEGANASIAALLPDGKRAAAVRINDVSGVGGFVQPNDSVDVLVTRQAGPDREAQLTDLLIQNARVIATDQDAKADGKAAVAKSATLEVDPIDAQKLALAQQIGTLSLVLRKPGEDQNDPLVETISLSDLRYGLYGSARYASARPTAVAQPRTVARAPVARRPAPAGPPRTSVEIVRGTEGSNYEVGDYGS